jgi:hypothetical protein
MWKGTDSFSYEKVSSHSLPLSFKGAERGDDAPRQPMVNARGCPRFLTLGLIVSLPTLLALLIIGGILLSRTWKPALSQITISAFIPDGYCGTTPAQAKAAGCAFELNNFAWMHPDCYDAELDKDWTFGPLSQELQFWEKYGGVGNISKELVMTGEIEKVWVNTRQHRRHCLFVWEKYQRAAMNMRPMDNWTRDYDHTKHCIMLLRDENGTFPDDLVSSYLTLKYPTCEYGPVQIPITP